MNVAQKEKTQNRVIKLFQEKLDYTYLGKWEDRTNSNIEEELLKLIKEKGLYDEFSSLNYFKLSPKVLRKEVDEDIINLTEKEKGHRLSLSKRGREND